MEEVEDEPLFCERVAGIDIGKAEISVTVRVPGETRTGGRRQEHRTFGTTCRELAGLAEWLRSLNVEKTGMESTSDYWEPVYFLLEREGLECILYQASQVKALPGRPKTGKRDSVWRRSPGRGRWPAASCRRRTSAGCGSIPVTGAS